MSGDICIISSKPLESAWPPTKNWKLWYFFNALTKLLLFMAGALYSTPSCYSQSCLKSHLTVCVYIYINLPWFLIRRITVPTSLPPQKLASSYEVYKCRISASCYAIVQFTSAMFLVAPLVHLTNMHFCWNQSWWLQVSSHFTVNATQSKCLQSYLSVLHRLSP